MTEQSIKPRGTHWHSDMLLDTLEQAGFVECDWNDATHIIDNTGTILKPDWQDSTGVHWITGGCYPKNSSGPHPIRRKVECSIPFRTQEIESAQC